MRIQNRIYARTRRDRPFNRIRLPRRSGWHVLTGGSAPAPSALIPVQAGHLAMQLRFPPDAQRCLHAPNPVERYLAGRFVRPALFFSLEVNGMKPLPSIELLAELIDYDPNTGVFIWKARRHGVTSGSVAGSLDHTGYRMISIKGVAYRAHRLAWKIMTGSDPVETIDHKNNKRDDNRFENLRPATRSQQRMNVTAAGVSKYLGVNWDKRDSKWRAKIMVNGKSRTIGRFDCEIEAAKAYDCVAADHHGQFANLNFGSE